MRTPIKECATFYIGKEKVNYKEFMNEVFNRFK